MSETDWHKIQRKLEGRCFTCGGILPEHIGVCPIYGEELIKKYENIDKQVRHIADITNNVLKKFGKNV